MMELFLRKYQIISNNKKNISLLKHLIIELSNYIIPFLGKDYVEMKSYSNGKLKLKLELTIKLYNYFKNEYAVEK